MFEVRENRLGDRLVAAARNPFRARVAAAQMDGEIGVGPPRADTLVEQRDIGPEQVVRVFAERAHALAQVVVEEIGQDRIVDLDIAAAGGLQRGDLLPVDGRDIGPESVHLRIGLAAHRRAPAVEMDAARRGDGDLRRLRGRRGQHLVVALHDIARPGQPGLGAHRARIVFPAGVAAGKRQVAVGLGNADAPDRLDEFEPPDGAAELAVGDRARDRPPSCTLATCADAIVLDLLQRVAVDFVWPRIGCRASSRRCGRSRLPTWSARKRGVPFDPVMVPLPSPPPPGSVPRDVAAGAARPVVPQRAAAFNRPICKRAATSGRPPRRLALRAARPPRLTVRRPAP